MPPCSHHVHMRSHVFTRIRSADLYRVALSRVSPNRHRHCNVGAMEVPRPDHRRGRYDIWSPGRVSRVANGLSDKRSPRARKILPAGALLWAWEPDAEFGEQAGEQWLILLPNKWNRHIQYGWRFDPIQLREDAERASAAAASALPQRRVRGAHGRGEPVAESDAMTDGEA